MISFKLESRRQSEKRIKREGSEIIYDDGRHRVLVISCPACATLYSRGTTWCTSDPAKAAAYLESGPLYIVFRDGRRYAQIHLPTAQCQDEEDNFVPPDADLTRILQQLVRPAEPADHLGLACMICMPLETPGQERVLLAAWSAESDDGGDDESMARWVLQYLRDHYAGDPVRRERLAGLAADLIEEGHLDLAWRLDQVGLLPLEEMARPLRRAVLRCLRTWDFARPDRLLRNFKGMDLTKVCLDYLPDDLIGLLWKLFRMGPSTWETVCSSRPAGKDVRQCRRRRHFLEFHDELQRVHAGRPALRATDTQPPITEGTQAAVA
jgi:hypothetical protein